MNNLCYNWNMDKVKFSLKDIFILIAFAFMLGIDGVFTLFYFIISFVFAFNKFSTPFNIIKTIQSNSYVIFGNVFISNVIYIVAGFIPGIIIGLAIKDMELPWWIDLFIKVVLYYITLQLFSCIWFWVVLLGVCLTVFIVRLVKTYKSSQSKRKSKNEESENLQT